MSIRALMLGLQEHLRQELNLSDLECDMQPFAQPPSIMGERYVAFCEDGVQGAGTSGQGASTMTKVYQVKVTVTRRTGKYGRDRLKNLYLDGLDAIDQLATQVVAKVHGSFVLMNLANAQITGQVRFVKPLWFLSQEPAALQGADWAGPTADNDGSTYIATVLRFGGAVRIQTIGLAQ